MPLTIEAKDSEKSFEQHPEGIFNACVVEIRDKKADGSPMLSSFNDGDGPKHRVALIFQTEAEIVGEDGPSGHFTIWDFHNIPSNLGNPKATLHKRINQIAGEGSIKSGVVNVDELIMEKPVKITVAHKDSGRAEIVSCRALKANEMDKAWKPVDYNKPF